MNKTSFKKILSMILIAAMIMTMCAGCAKKGTEATGAKEFTFVVVDKAGNEETFQINTERAIVGDALMDEKLIEGDSSEYGLYVTKVNGIEAIYENDGTYWAFYVNGQYAMTGVDTTDIENGATYMFKVEGN